MDASRDRVNATNISELNFQKILEFLKLAKYMKIPSYTVAVSL